jgi:hypothetical protein
MYTVGLLDSGAINLFLFRVCHLSFCSDVWHLPTQEEQPQNLEANTEGVPVSTGKRSVGARACLTNYAQIASPSREISRIFCREF